MDKRIPPIKRFKTAWVNRKIEPIFQNSEKVNPVVEAGQLNFQFENANIQIGFALTKDSVEFDFRNGVKFNIQGLNVWDINIVNAVIGVVESIYTQNRISVLLHEHQLNIGDEEALLKIIQLISEFKCYNNLKISFAEDFKNIFEKISQDFNIILLLCKVMFYRIRGKIIPINIINSELTKNEVLTSIYENECQKNVVKFSMLVAVVMALEPVMAKTSAGLTSDINNGVNVGEAVEAALKQ